MMGGKSFVKNGGRDGGTTTRGLEDGRARAL